MISSDTICATATAPGTGALGIIRISGKEAIAITNRIFKGKDLEQVASHTVHYGFIVESQKLSAPITTRPIPPEKSSVSSNALIIDEVMVTVFRAPKTFTAEDLVEITCHGSPYIQEQIISLLLKNGCRLAQPGEFTQRAFLNGRIDLVQAEAVADLIAAENKASHEIALNQMRGGISNDLQQVREKLIHFTALIELELDFTEEDVEFANRDELRALIQDLQAQIQKLLATFEYGNAIKNGVPVAIIGKPNAGKSTLLNALVNEERAIVSDIAGTTRDVIEETVHLQGITFRFIDTAGIRQTQDQIEAIGVEKAKEKVQQARVVIHLYEQDLSILDELASQLEGKIVFNLLSKSDKNSKSDEYFEQLQKEFPQYYHFGISVKTGYHLDRLQTALVRSITSGVDHQAVIITNLRHKEALEKTQNALQETQQGLDLELSGDLLAIHLKEALYYLGSITGQIDVDTDILGTIFGKFCIGK